MGKAALQQGRLACNLQRAMVLLSAESGKTRRPDLCVNRLLCVVCFLLIVSSSLLAAGANQRATTLPIPRVVTSEQDPPHTQLLGPQPFSQAEIILHAVANPVRGLLDRETSRGK